MQESNQTNKWFYEQRMSIKYIFLGFQDKIMSDSTYRFRLFVISSFIISFIISYIVVGEHVGSEFQNAGTKNIVLLYVYKVMISSIGAILGTIAIGCVTVCVLNIFDLISKELKDLNSRGAKKSYESIYLLTKDGKNGEK